ncbi:MAG: alpha/beta hydrolase [bacterium]
MAFIECNFYSNTLALSTTINVILPDEAAQSDGKHNYNKRYPTLYLLHGLSDDHTIWQRKSSIERYVEKMGLAVVMPAVNRSFYTDMVHGLKYWTYITEELTHLTRTFFPLSDKREDNFVAGISMGGYGSFKIALSYPERYSAAASLSGAMDIVARSKIWTDEFQNIFANVNKLKGSQDDLYYLANKVDQSTGPKPKLYQCCGKEDFLYDDNIKFRDFCTSLSLEYIYEEEKGEHNWDYWDTKIKDVLKWLPIVR